MNGRGESAVDVESINGYLGRCIVLVVLQVPIIVGDFYSGQVLTQPSNTNAQCRPLTAKTS